ncbi:MAG: ArsR family transcriptional regulator [Methanomicrobiales archaeon]|nr:ArsR family transcriptional regulator [Methanomicrobiales archaeon]
MREKTIQVFTEHEEEFVSLLIGVGMRRTVAMALVFLINTKEATSRDIERGTDLRQPEVSLAIKYMADQGWISYKDIPSEWKGRPARNYSLAKTVPEIMSAIEKQLKSEANHQLTLLKKMREFL